MNQIDVNYIVEGKVEVFDWVFVKRVGIDGDKNYVYLVEDKFREHRYAKFVPVPDPQRIKEHIAQLLILQNSHDSKLIQPIFDFTVSKEKKLILVTMPVPPRTLLTVIKDTKVDLKVRLLLVRNLANGGVYMHNRRRTFIGQIRPQTIVIHEDMNVYERGKSSKRNSGNSAQLYPRFNSFCTLVQSQTKAEKWKWDIAQLQYYDAPQIWLQIDKKKKINDNQSGCKSQKSVQTKPHSNRYTIKSDVWALGLIFVQLLTAMKISQLLQNAVPGRLLRDLVKQSLKSNSKKAENISIEPEKIQEDKQLVMNKFYDKLLKSVECFTLRTLIEKMLSFKPEKRPTTEQVMRIVEHLQIIDKRNKNMGRIASYRKSLKNLKECEQSKISVKPEEGLEDNKSIVSMKSVRSGKSNKSYYSQTRKRVPQDFSALLYARQVITELHSTPTNPLYRTYFEDCKNRLPSDINFALPPKKLLMRKEDKAIVMSLKGDQDEDLKKWNVEKVMGEKIPSAYQQRIMQKVSKQSQVDSQKSKDENGQGGENRIKSYKGWVRNQPDTEPFEECKTTSKEKSVAETGKLNFGPVVKRVPQNPAALKQQAYNENLSNYHYVGVENLKKYQHFLTCLNRKEAPITADTPEREVQFILNLKFQKLAGVPVTLAEQLHFPNSLKYLSLAHNQISSLRGLKFCFQLQKSLMVLDASYNCLTKIDIEFWEFNQLEEAYFMNNRIEHLNGIVQSSLEIQIQPNEIQSECFLNESRDIPACGRKNKEPLSAVKVRKLYLNSNQVKILQNVDKLPSLEVLSVGHNPLCQNAANLRTIEALRTKGVKVFY